MTYLILANLSLVLFFGIYLLVLKRLTFFQWNRIYLISAVIVSFAIPLLQFVDLSLHREVYRPLAVIDFVEMEPIALTGGVADSGKWSVMDGVWLLYGIGAVLMLLWLGIRLCRASVAFKKQTDDRGSFSFFNRVFIAAKSDQRAVIVSHEEVHRKQGHSYDILFLEIIRAFNWFNPIFYFYVKELKFQHECIADEACAEDSVQYAELLVAHAMGVSPNMLLHEFSNQSLLKRRIMMLFKNKSRKINGVKYLLVLPTLLLIAGVTLAFNTSIKEVVEAEVERLEPRENTVQQDTAKSNVDAVQPRMTLKGKAEIKPQEQEEVFTAVENPPEPEGGLNAFRQWFGQNFSYPQEAIDAGVKGKGVVSFTVEKDGTLSNFKIIEDLGYGTSEAAIETLKKAKPWNPGTQNGRKVRVLYTLPFTLNLQQ